jgi:hypothetical protein
MLWFYWEPRCRASAFSGVDIMLQSFYTALRPCTYVVMSLVIPLALKCFPLIATDRCYVVQHCTFFVHSIKETHDGWYVPVHVLHLWTYGKEFYWIWYWDYTELHSTYLILVHCGPVWHYQKKSSESGTGSTQPREYNWGATW